MKKEILKYFDASAGTLTIKEIVMGFVVAIIIAMIIYASYRFSHSGAVYSRKFNVSLVMITLITTLIMTVIGDNVALSLGMVGALSIVRFRTAIKDARDTAYIFWCVAVGISCGVQDFVVAAIGSAFVFVVMLVIGNSDNNDRYLLIIRGDKAMSEDVPSVVEQYFGGKAKFCVENVNRDKSEEIYEVSERLLKKSEAANNERVREILFKVKGVESVNLVCQNDEISR